MLIVLEGVNGAGKTRLKDKLALRHGARTTMLHCAYPKQDPMIEYEWSLRDYDRRDLSTLWICDRWHVSELVLGPLLRNRSRLTAPAAKHVEMFLDALGALKIILTEDIEEIRDRLRERGDRLTHNQVGLAWDSFNSYAEDHPSWRVEISSKVYPKALINKARQAQLAALKLAGLGSYVGSVNPKYLILTGHRPHAPNLPDFKAALTPHQGAQRYHAIMDRLMPFEQFGIMSQDGDQISAAWQLLNQPEVIVTDPEALSACAIAGIKATPITKSTVI